MADLKYTPKNSYTTFFNVNCFSFDTHTHSLKKLNKTIHLINTPTNAHIYYLKF